MNSLVSICIPTFKQPELFEKCLQSVVMQSYKLVEVLISDDTPDDAVKIIVGKFAHQLNISYQKNEMPLGSPENWNSALKNAKGRYVLLLHHDDAFSTTSSLDKFLAPFERDGEIDFVFGRNTSVEKISGEKNFSFNFFLKYYKQPHLLLTGNFIGAPSNVMLKSTAVEYYHPKYKWIVDIQFYIRLFQKRRRFYYVDEKLIDIGIHPGQISNECVNNNEVLLFENIYYASENKLKINSIILYDFYWRLIRNAGIKSIEQLQHLDLKEEATPAFIRRIIRFQQKLPQSSLRIGIISKFFMATSYLINRWLDSKNEKTYI